MEYKDKLKIIKRNALTDKEKMRVDQFILSENTNGEFINSLKYLEYHPKDRFVDDSIVVVDAGSNSVRGLMMAAQKQGEPSVIISHPGTTFAGPIIDNQLRIKEKQIVLDVLLGYYEKKYKKIQIRTEPSCFTVQPYGVIDYFLLSHGYKYEIFALSNVIALPDVHTEEDVLKMFSANKRNHTKKVIRNSKFYLKRNTEIDSTVWKNMADNLKEKYGVTITHSFDEIVDLQLRCKKFIDLYYIMSSDGEYGAFGLSFKYKKVFHTQYLDLNYKYSRDNPNMLLIFKMIQGAIDEGYRYFSFGASTEDNGKFLNKSLYDYKAEYGGGDIVLPVYEKLI